MEKDTIFTVLFKSNSKGEKNLKIFQNFVTELLDQDIYKKHIVSVHEKRKPVKCLICDADISLKSNSIKHIFRRCL